MKYHYITRSFIVLLKGLVIFEDDRDDRPRVHTPGAFLFIRHLRQAIVKRAAEKSAARFTIADLTSGSLTGDMV